MTKTEKLISFIIFWLVIFACSETLHRCNQPLVAENRNVDPVWIVIADDKCWETFDRPQTAFNVTSWTTREGGTMRVAGDVYYLEVVDGNMSKAYFQLGVSEEQCLNL